MIEIDELAFNAISLFQKYKKTYDIDLGLLILFMRGFLTKEQFEVRAIFCTRCLNKKLDKLPKAG